jgi:hypothetical protein
MFSQNLKILGEQGFGYSFPPEQGILCKVDVVNNVPPFHESYLVGPNNSKELKLDPAH